MINRYNILNGFVMMLALLCSSCISTEDYEVNTNHSGTIEFVCRPTSYNGQIINTKAVSVDDFENKIYNCYFMLYNKDGNRVYGPIDLNATLSTQRFSKSNFKAQVGELGTYTACFVANVPTTIVENNLNTLDALQKAIIDIAYVRENVNTDNKNSFFVIPEFDLNGSGEQTKCLPMFGMKECNIATDDLVQIPLKRLFAKVSVNIGVTASGATFDILAAHLFNLPTNVRLVEPDAPSYESAWVKNPSAFLSHQIEGPVDDDDIYGGIVNGTFSRPYEFYFYVPEYYLQPKSSNTNEKDKPKMFDESKRPVFVRIFGTYDDDNKTSNITYDLYLGENEKDSFTLQRNIHYINSMTINGITNSKDGVGETLDLRVKVTTEKFDEVEVYGQTANCYIIGQTGTYKYPACKGVFKGGVNDIPDDMKCKKGTRLRVLYQDNSSVKLENLTFNKETCEFSFDVVSVDGGTGILSSNDGNVILGLVYYEEGQEKVEWSWHLWVQSGTSLDMDLGFFDFSASSQTYPNSYVMMDRNLGARPTLLQTPGTVIGAYYKYGEHTPYLDTLGNGTYSKCGGGSIDGSSTWNTSRKSVTDPCPPGYRVPSSDVWKEFSPTNEHSSILNAFIFWKQNTGDLNLADDIYVYYPYSGELSGNVINTTQNVPFTLYTTPDEVITYSDLDPEYSKEYNGTGWDRLNTYRDVTTERIKYYDFKYSITSSSSFGQLLSNSSNLLRYEYAQVSKNQFKDKCIFVQCKTQTYQIRAKEIRRGTSFTGYRWEIVETYNEEPIPGSESTLTDKTSLPSDWLNKLADNQCTGSIITGYNKVITQNSFPSSNTSYGYQVRCVKE